MIQAKGVHTITRVKLRSELRILNQILENRKGMTIGRGGDIQNI